MQEKEIARQFAAISMHPSHATLNERHARVSDEGFEGIRIANKLWKLSCAATYICCRYGEASFHSSLTASR